jgi:alkyldihydroxyacetonephosphate synthase
MIQPRLKHFGWGREGEGLTSAEEAFVFGRIEQQFGPVADGEVKPPRLEDIKIETPRLNPPASLPFCSTALYDRAAHTYGKSFPDYVRGLAGDYSNAPDVVAYPRTEEEIAAVFDWAGGAQASVTPFGGGSSVVGGVEPRRDAARHKAAVTIDLRELGRVLEVDKPSRAARIEAGAFGPALEAQLKPHGLTLRHFPQSFECSTLGGWIATRSGGHFATLYTHIDDLVESLRVITPMGLIETRRLPGSGAGPSPDRLLIGSEGILGICSNQLADHQRLHRFLEDDVFGGDRHRPGHARRQAVVGYASIQTAAPARARHCTSVSPDQPAQDRRNDRSPRWPEIVRVSAIPRFLPAR